jgi:hypothetical protein
MRVPPSQGGKHGHRKDGVAEGASAGREGACRTKGLWKPGRCPASCQGTRLSPVIGAATHLSNNPIGQCTETRYIYSAP